MSRQENTREKLISLAGRMMREHGYSAFSYADLSAQIGISKASIHHHFSAKADLGAAVAQENCAVFQAALDNIAAKHALFAERLAAYFSLFADTPGQLPMCAALAADKNNLPDVLKSQAEHHFELQIEWLAAIIRHAATQGELAADIHAEEWAVFVLNAVEGAGLTAKALGRRDVFALSLQNLLKCFKLMGA
ncbi:MAG: TetR/AcrR family transcriptional regulator [Neisseria sp.]|nr:TetR/AcrR family transcriptional regulator [Neisseria sp.]